VQVTFVKPSEKHRLCAWTAVRGRRTVVPGTVMAAGAGLPHDLAQYVVEATFGVTTGFWGLVARGATFKSTGRRITRPGRALVIAHRTTLDAAERLAGEHVSRWRDGRPTKAAAPLSAALDAWHQLELGDGLVFRWQEPTGEIVPDADSGTTDLGAERLKRPSGRGGSRNRDSPRPDSRMRR
jgi:hypothetical protein